MNDTSVGIHEAKTQFSRLIKNVKRGQQITITQRGQPVAVLMPFVESNQIKSDRLVAINNIRNFRDQQSPIAADKFEQFLRINQK